MMGDAGNKGDGSLATERIFEAGRDQADIGQDAVFGAGGAHAEGYRQPMPGYRPRAAALGQIIRDHPSQGEHSMPGYGPRAAAPAGCGLTQSGPERQPEAEPAGLDADALVRLGDIGRMGARSVGPSHRRGRAAKVSSCFLAIAIAVTAHCQFFSKTPVDFVFCFVYNITTATRI